jgi:hypothetical protein
MRVSNVLVRRAHEDDLPRLGELLRTCVAHMQARGIDQWDDVYPTEATLRVDIAAGTLYVARRPATPSPAPSSSTSARSPSTRPSRGASWAGPCASCTASWSTPIASGAASRATS